MGNWIIYSAWRPLKSQAQGCPLSGSRSPVTGLMLKAKTSGPRGLGRSKAEPKGAGAFSWASLKNRNLGKSFRHQN